VARARCDPFDIAGIRAAIASGQISERVAYLNYASGAARPFARSTFSGILRRTSPDQSPDGPPEQPGPLPERWRDRMPVKPRILALGPGGGLRVQRGALIVFNGEMRLIYTKAAKPPSVIILSAVGGYVSIDAVRFAAQARIAIIALDRSHVFLSVMTPSSPASAALIRAQASADAVRIARAIVAAKLEAMRRAGALGAEEEKYRVMLDQASNLAAIRIVEAQAARVAWPDPPRLKWERGPIPADLAAPWLMRTRLDAKGRRGARHPVNAMLNAAFAVAAGRLTAYLAGTGFAPAIGYLHMDKRGRHSLAWDAIEVLRPIIEARLFAMIKRERFALTDFVRAPDGSLRLSSELFGVMLNEVIPTSNAFASVTRWIKRLILPPDRNNSAIFNNVKPQSFDYLLEDDQSH
jgi:CRISP-associated protein Cas1